MLLALDNVKPSATPAPSTKSTADLAKEALLQTIKSEATTAKDVLGEGGLASLRQVLGEERAGALIGALDGLLANRRLATLIFAVADVALIWVIIKVARSAVTQE
ncbi:hypothetical protein PLESTB_000650800 [Pleodorina starrii]|uniref:Uncharacterized protein n=1 Tax=Pleodorina starrii TaxID=330485 RepID=A0A9W6BIV4_9CHLO|nr:hypothetical protein PLESTM_001311800 [Pleodorina starrii]GLC52628.1 hypothetical protein PLESTB_000650800 [Pleodorina starrii]